MDWCCSPNTVLMDGPKYNSVYLSVINCDRHTSSWWNKTWCCSAVLHTMWLICLLVQWHDPPVSTQISQSRSAYPPYNGMRLGHLSQVWWHGVIPPPSKMRVLCWIRTWFTLLFGISKDCGSLQEGTVLFFAALTKKMCARVSWLLPSIFRVLWKQMQRDLRDRERMRSSCASDTPERGSSSAPGGALQCGLGPMRNGRGTVLPGPSHVSLCFHHHLCPPSAQMWKFRENKQMLFDKSK